MKAFFTVAAIVAVATAGPGHQLDFANVSCPPGYNLVGKNCEQPIIAPAQIVCPLGVLQGDKCVTAVPQYKECPIGSIPDGKECHVVNSMAPSRSCPPGFQDNGNSCLQQIPLPTQEMCDQGRPDGAGNCIVVENTNKITRTFCPPGFYDEGKGCMKITEYDCSPPQKGKSEPLPPPPMPLAYGGKKWKKRMLGAKKAVYAPIPIIAPPPSKAMIPAPIIAAPQPVAPAPSKVHVTRQTCQRKDFAPPVVETFCPEGYYETGKNCMRQLTFPMVKQCINGNSVANCFEHKATSHIVNCPKGVLVGDSCQWKQPVPMELVCPAGTYLQGNECVQTTQPLVHCPNGLTLDGRSCIGRNVVEPVGIVTKPCQGKECWQGSNVGHY